MPFTFTPNQVQAYHESTEVGEFDSSFFGSAESLLDIGCGDGKITAHLAEKFPHLKILGTDVSEAMIEFAKDKYPTLSFAQKDALALHFHEEFDRILCVNCLHWITDQNAAISEIAQSLKPGGKAKLIVSPKSSGDDLQICCRKLILSWKWFFSFVNFKSSHSFHTQGEYEDMFRNNKLHVESITEKTKEAFFEDRPALENFLSAVLTPMYHLPKYRRRSFLEGLFAKLKKHGSVAKDGSITLRIKQMEMLIYKHTSI